MWLFQFTRPELDPYAFSYLDDIVIVTETFDDHLKLLRYVLLPIKEAGLSINRVKSVSGQTEAKYLELLINRDGYRPDPEKIAPVINYPAPKNLK